MTDAPDVIVLSISFIDDMVQVEFLETRKQTDHVAHVESQTVNRELAQTEVEELEAAARDLLDKIAVIQRNPPSTRRRFNEGDDD